jgi:L-ascorbate metabolism protein UlaG (beta-lactamase superfamily)
MHSKPNFHRIFNPDLPIVKDGWKGNVSANGRFFNDTIIENLSMRDVLKWKLSRNPQRKEKKQDTFQLQTLPLVDFASKENKIVWLGHSSFIIVVDGIVLLTDPCFFNLPPCKRKALIPCSIKSLKPIDYLLISHDHRDHFDQKSAEHILTNNPNVTALIPLKASRLFDSKTLKKISKQEAGWYQEYKTGKNIRIIFLPAKHWGRRGLNDFNRVLWGSFLIVSGNTKIFFAGDSAYDEHLFKEIRQLFGDIDVCMLPIGAYSPPFLMQKAHMNPEEAVQAFSDLGGRYLIPMHYGTYDLSDEPLSEPITRLHQYISTKGMEHQVKELSVGEKCWITDGYKNIGR